MIRVISVADQLILLIKARSTIRMLRTVDQLITLSMEDLLMYIDPELDTFMVRVQLISYRYILL